MTTNRTMTPMLEQYFRLKAEQPEALLMFRLGDFYELFDADAQVAAPLLDLQLTSRDGRMPMCGVPHHALNQYAKKLLESGYMVAIAEQMEDPAQAKGLVERQIVRVLTPGTVIPDDDGRSPRLAVRYRHRQGLVAVMAELSTGSLHIAEVGLSRAERQSLADLWALWAPDEYLSNDSEDFPEVGTRVDEPLYFRRQDRTEMERLLTERLGLAGLRRWGLEDRIPVQEALLILWRYLERMQRRTPVHLTDVRIHGIGQRLALSPRAVRQLDLVDGPHSLLAQLDYTMTPMGARRLAEWVQHPLTDKQAIDQRQAAVSWWVAHPLERADLREWLRGVGDLGRRGARMAMGVGRPRDAAGIGQALRALPKICRLVEEQGVWQPLEDVVMQDLATLGEALDVFSETVPARWEDGPLIRAGVSDSLDRCRSLLEDQRGALLELEQKERERSGIGSLRVGLHRTFGYYLEVTRSQAKTVPSDWHRRQTTAHTERFTSEALSALEQAIREAEASVSAEERAWAERIQASVRELAGPISVAASWLADVDALTALAEAAVKHGYHCPQFSDGPLLIRGLRHPVLERVLSHYVTSDLRMSSIHCTLIITGPNMGGKSTFMRALAQNVILAQMGSWVAAEEYQAPLFDAVLTRMGADDDLVRGQSTFMVEMEEVAAILHQATSASLVLLDELGRGTSTYDGLAIAEAVVERLAMPDGPLALFATHYHELTQMADDMSQVMNLTVEVLEGPQGPVFTHRVIPGQASRSYGIEVARLAGLPASLVRRAEHHLRQWEGSMPTVATESPQLDFFQPDPLAGPVLDALRALTPDDLSPREAWLWIAEWHRRIQGQED
ncbi:DNA mismatch repair protein MutS [Sulfobacillus harzensis]|uniref:DNA mismatch repair protein MutS n=1 Tax=Sulfobacillus harzensis TaxID=2729629 RepID=A0A7Y0L159_9FIRM|nr:DNA mismatch repair protein MutS [Sulfobacillus harzensis]NMP20831.1 DNA mismatch repair protein MutS [Sulfobacillus harzensis]